MSLQSPILIVGAVRSGTTMFRLMLGHHSRVGYAQEHEFGFDELGDSGFPDVAELHQQLETHRQFLARGFTIDRSLSYRDLLLDFLRQADAVDSKPEVAAVIHSGFHRAPELWPDARFIHVLRDPRDVANSIVTIGWAGNPFYGADTWVTAERRWDRVCAVVPPERRYEIRYEELVSDPEATLRGVCGFLGLEYEPGMLDYDSDTSYGKPDGRLAYQWRKRMSPRDAARVEAKCGELVAARGYEQGPPAQLPQLEQAYLWLDHRAGRLQKSIRKYGPALWTLQRVARVLPSEALRRQLKMRQNAIDRQHLK